MPEAELAVFGGRVITVDRGDRIAEAIAVVDGRIAAVGTASEIRAMCGKRTRVLDARGGAVLPGINDSHLHAFGVGLNRPPLMLDVSQAGSIAAVAELVRAKAEQTPPGTWIQGTGWDAAFLDECREHSGRLPERADLDAATTRHPVALEECYGHSTWVNSEALRVAGIDAETESPAGSEIVRDAAGQPTGLLREFGAQALVHRCVPEIDRERRRQAIASTFELLTPLGITSFTDPALGPGGDRQLGGAFHQDGIEVYAELARARELRARVNVLLLFGEPEAATDAEDMARGLREYQPPADVDPAWLRIAGVKIFADGIPPSRTAWMTEPYTDRPEEYGSLVIGGDDDWARQRELTKMVALAHEAGYQVGAHATGDRAVDAVVAAYLAARRSGGDPDPRHYVIHGDLLSAETIAAMARERIGLNPQPAIQTSLGEMLPEVIGKERTERQHALRGVFDAGVPVALSSDAPVTDPDWRKGVAAAVLRESRASGKVIGSRHRIRVLEAIRAYTLGGAWQDHAEDWKGSIEVGKVADLCVLGADPLEVDPHELPEVPIRGTILDGEVIYEG